MIKAVIFDLDGVLVFTDKYHFAAWKTIADRENIYFDETINNRLRGVSRMDSLNIILERSSKVYTEEEKEVLASQKNEIYRNFLSTMTDKDVSDSVRSTLSKLNELGIKVGLGSSSKNAPYILEKTNLTSYFDSIVDGSMISHSKPNPEVFLKCAELLNVKPYDALVIEDAVSGIDAANAGGFKSVGIGDASHYDKASYSIKDIKEIIKIVGGNDV